MASTISHSRLIVVDTNYVARRAERRARRIALARANLQQGVRERERPRSSDRTAVSTPLFLLVALGLHGAVALGALHIEPRKTPQVEKIQVRVVTAPPPAIEPEPLPVKVETPPPELAEAPKPVAKKAPKKPAPEPEVAPAPMPIVGLTLESTSSGAGGPVFAIGSTLAGATERVARTAQPTPPVRAPAPVATVSRNRTAAARPPAGVHVQPAKRLSRVEPTYPALLQSQRIEGDVSVRVALDGEGRVQHVEIVRGAKESAFNEAALAAARIERFSPETHDGRPVPTALTYTYRFRISL
jgi:protein TonB